MNVKLDSNILLRGQDVIPYSDFEDLVEIVQRLYHHTGHTFWMWKMLQIGFVYGKQAERAKKKKTA